MRCDGLSVPLEQDSRGAPPGTRTLNPRIKSPKRYVQKMPSRAVTCGFVRQIVRLVLSFPPCVGKIRARIVSRETRGFCIRTRCDVPHRSSGDHLRRRFVARHQVPSGCQPPGRPARAAVASQVTHPAARGVLNGAVQHPEVGLVPASAPSGLAVGGAESQPSGRAVGPALGAHPVVDRVLVLELRVVRPVHNPRRRNQCLLEIEAVQLLPCGFLQEPAAPLLPHTVVDGADDFVGENDVYARHDSSHVPLASLTLPLWARQCRSEPARVPSVDIVFRQPEQLVAPAVLSLVSVLEE